jgi:CubicO group peptidase (beta-lactamase class C family)
MGNSIEANQTTRRSMIASILVSMILLGLLFACPIAASQDDDASYAGNLFAAALEENMPLWLVKYNAPGAVVSYIDGGDVTWTKAFGVADRRTGAPMHTDSAFCFASCAKSMTAWAIMHLVEQGQLDLDAPVDQYLKRWHLPPSQFDPGGVTIRRVLSHTAGLTVQGYGGYFPRRHPVPSLEQVLDGQNQGNGAVEVAWEPGGGFHYSGGGYTVLQMVIEDVTGEPYAEYVKREILNPLGLTEGDWTWTPALKNSAATPYGFRGDDVMEYRQFATLGIGNYISSVPDFARFIATGVPGPNGEPAGRGVLKPDTVALITSAQPDGIGYGFGYAVGQFSDGTPLVLHGGASDGWVAFFALAPEQRNGFVFAAASNLAQPLRYSVYELWATVGMGKTSPIKPEALMPTANPDKVSVPVSLILAAVLGAIAIRGAVRLRRDIHSGRRWWQPKPGPLSAITVGFWGLFAAMWVYYFHASLRMWLPPSVPDFIWPREIIWVTLALTACTMLSVIKAFYTKKERS